MFKKTALMAVLMSTTLISPFLPLTSVVAQHRQNPPVTIANSAVIPSGTLIPIQYQQSDKILIKPNETASLTVTVARDIRDRQGVLIIPAGSQINGDLQPTENGTQFIAREIIINNQSYYLDATSGVVTTTETVKTGATTADIITGTLAGAGAATIIAGTTGDRRIDALEVLAGAAVGTLAGWGLPEAGVIGGGEETYISINPNRDLTLTVQSPTTISF
jgi:hypothetical protein